MVFARPARVAFAIVPQPALIREKNAQFILNMPKERILLGANKGLRTVIVMLAALAIPLMAAGQI